MEFQTHVSIFTSCVSLVMFFLALVWSSKTWINVFLKGFMFIFSVYGLLIFLQSSNFFNGNIKIF